MCMSCKTLNKYIYISWMTSKHLTYHVYNGQHMTYNG